jgi:high-affinity iron transporter
MQRHSRTLKREITARATAAGSGFALGLLAFTTVGREAVESAFFTLAFAFQTNGVLLLLGAALGILAAIALCFLIYRMGYGLDYRLFFRVMGIVLLFFAAGLLGNAVQNMQELGWLPFGTTTLWNTSHILSEENPVGDLLHGFLGYAQAPSLLQAIAYSGFLIIAGGFFWRLTRRTALPQPSSSTTPAGTSRQTA